MEFRFHEPALQIFNRRRWRLTGKGILARTRAWRFGSHRSQRPPEWMCRPWAGSPAFGTADQTGPRRPSIVSIGRTSKVGTARNEHFSLFASFEPVGRE